MGTYSNNTTIKVNAAVSATATYIVGGAVTLYTAPASGFAYVQIANTAGTVTALSVGGRVVLTGGSLVAGVNFLIVGPGQSITFTGSGTTTVVASGVEFLNTP